jgi:hypothetical protein
MSEPSVSLSPEEFDELIALKLRERSTSRSNSYRKQEYLWTALAPCWTILLAELSKFPITNIESFFQSLSEQSLLKVSEVRGEASEAPRPSVYTMDDVVRGDVIDAYSQDRDWTPELYATISVVGKNILEAIKSSGSPAPNFAPASVTRWAQLAASASSPRGLVQEFDAQVEAAFESRSSSIIRDWMNAATPLSAILLRLHDDSMRQALHRASQRLILLRREESDRRHLKFFYRRDEQLVAFEKLMRSDDSEWALHFLGAGGVGKTMLVRKITVDWANEHDAIAARVDFDYLKADYPTLDPGMLLWAFAQDLRAHAGAESIRLFNYAERKFEELSRRIRAEIADGRRRRATEHPDFADAISLYCDALRLIPKRVVLIVDTCEELAKIGIGLTPVQNIDETFRILRALHDGPGALTNDDAPAAGGVPNLRVIFSGRRPLAVEGTNWECPSARQLKPRRFLNLHEVRGFTKLDAAQFLREKMQVKEDLVSAIVTRSSPDTGSVAEIKWTNPKDEPSGETRCNPYDLKLYADWSNEAPPPTAAQILATPPATQYVELRVIRRLHVDLLKEALPAIALLGHFDHNMLRAVFGKKQTVETTDELFDLLQQEEWINQRVVQDQEEGSTLMLDVEPGIRTRLFVYYQKSPLFAEVQPGAADYLEKLTLEGDPNRLDWSYFDAALTVLESDPDKDRVVRWWQKLDELMFSSCLPEWIRTTTDKLQNEGGAAAWRDPNSSQDVPPESRVRPAILATYASALLRSSKRTDLMLTWRELTGIWKEVYAKVGAIKSALPELEIRGLAGFISASLRVGDTEPDLEKINLFWTHFEELATPDLTKSSTKLDSLAEQKLGELKRVHLYDLSIWKGDGSDMMSRWVIKPQLLASLVAAAEAIVEYVDTPGRRDSSTMRRLLDRSLFSNTDSIMLKLQATLFSLSYEQKLNELSAFAMCLAAKSLAWMRAGERNHFEHENQFKLPFSVSSFADNLHGNANSPWRDWIPPEDLASRIRLEFIRSAYPKFMSPQRVLQQLEARPQSEGNLQSLEIPFRLKFIDNERLHSALLSLRFADGLVPEDKLRFKQSEADTQPDLVVETATEPVCRAHQETPPLLVTMGEIQAHQDDADEVLTSLAAVARSRGNASYQTQLDIDRVRSRVIAKLRLRDVGERGGEILIASANVADRSLAWELDALEGPKYSGPIPQLPDELQKVVVTSDAARTDQQVEKLRWLHAIWQTRAVYDEITARLALDWAIQNLHGLLVFPDPPFYELLAVQLDCFEAIDLGARYSQAVDLGPIKTKRVDPEVFRDNTNLRDEARLILWLRARALKNLGSDTKYPIPSVEQLGTRRSAEIALHEADLLSLRFPDLAGGLYSHAFDLFRASNDPKGQFIAGTSAVMCSPKSLDLNLIQESYLRLGGPDHTFLPKTESLLAQPADMTNPVWAPRSLKPRIVRYLLLLADQETDPKKRTETGKALIKLSLPGAIAASSRTPGVELLPADLTNWFTERVEAPSIFRRVWNVLKPILQGLLGLVVIVAGFSFIFMVFRRGFSYLVPDFPGYSGWLQFGTMAWVATILGMTLRAVLKVPRKPITSDSSHSESTQASSEYPAWRVWVDAAIIWLMIIALVWFYSKELLQRFGWLAVVSTVLVLLGSSLFFLFRGRFSGVWDFLWERYLEVNSGIVTSLTTMKVDITESRSARIASESSLTEVPEVELRINVVFKLIPIWLMRLLSPKLTTELIFSGLELKSGLDPYERLGAELNSVESFTSTFVELHRLLHKYSLQAEVNLSEGPVNGLCWEALFQSELDPKKGTHGYLPINCIRGLSAVRQSPAMRLKQDGVLIFGETQAARKMGYAWTDPSTGIDPVRFATRSTLEKVDDSVSVVHVVGSLESSYRSVGIRTGEEQVHLNGSSSKVLTDDDALIRPEDLMHAFPNLAVCVLQASPREGRPERLEGDRRDAFYARLFASQLFAAGVPCVLVVPALEVGLADGVIFYFSMLMYRNSRLTSSAMLACIGMFRLWIASSAADSNMSDLAKKEVPQDLCLYFDSNWDG